jgi:hypothetical protein
MKRCIECDGRRTIIRTVIVNSRTVERVMECPRCGPNAGPVYHQQLQFRPGDTLRSITTKAKERMTE